MIDGVPTNPSDDDEIRGPDWEARDRTGVEDHDSVDPISAMDQAQGSGRHPFLAGVVDDNTNATANSQGDDSSNAFDMSGDQVSSLSIPPEQTAGNDQIVEATARPVIEDAGEPAPRTEEPSAPNAPVEEPGNRDDVDDQNQGEDRGGENDLESFADEPRERRAIDISDQLAIQARGDDFFKRYHRGGGLTGSETIEERRLGGVLPFIGMLGFDVFDRAEVRVVNESRYIVGKEDDKFIVSLDQAGGLPDDIILATNGRRFEIKVIGDDTATTVALLDIENDTDVLPRMFHSLSREGFDLGHLRDMATRGAIEDVLREAILEELRDPSSQFRHAISTRLAARGYDDSALGGLATIGQNIAADALTGENEPEAEEESDRRPMKPDEQRAFEAIKETLGAYIDAKRVVARPGVQYTAILLDDNNRRSIARLYYNATSNKYLATLTGRQDKNKVDETKHLITSLDDIHKFDDKIVARLKEVEPASVP